MILNEQKTKILLRESIKSPMYGEYDEFQIAAAMVIEHEIGYPYEDILVEGWFGDKLKGIGKFLKKSVTEPAKYAWAKHMPELYGQQTYKFWKRKELKAAAEKEFASTIDSLAEDVNDQAKDIIDDIKSQIGSLKEVKKGELAFPNMKSTEDFYQQLFGAQEWSECEKIFDALENGGNVPQEFTAGLFGKMATIKIMYQNNLDTMSVNLAPGAGDDGEASLEEYKKNSNKKLGSLRNLIQKYAQDCKEIYQTFENKDYLDGYVDRLLTEATAESENPTAEEIEKKTEEIAKSVGISPDRLSAMKARQSPIRPIIAAVLLGIAGAIGIKIGMDQMNASMDAYEAMLKAKDLKLDAALKELENRVIPDSLEGINVTQGYTQTVMAQANILSPMKELTEEAIQKMSISDFQGDYAGPLGFGKEFWEQSGANGAESFELLQKMVSENPDMSVANFFKQSGQMAAKLSGKTLDSPFGLKGGIGVLMKKGAKKALTKGTKNAMKLGVGGYTFAGATAFGLPAATVAGIFAASAAVGLLVVAGIRKFKGNRQKLLLGCIDALDDIQGPRPSAVKQAEPILDENPELETEVIPEPDADIPESAPSPGAEQDTDSDPLSPTGAEGCEQTEFGLTQFMKKYDKDKAFSNKPGDGKPKKMSTMFNGQKLDKKFSKLSPEELQKDLDATAKKYNRLLGQDIFTVSKEVDNIKKVVDAPINDSVNNHGALLLERWSKLAGIH